MPIHISNKKVNDIHVGSKKVLSAWVGTDRVFIASTLSMLIKGYTEKSGDSLLSVNTPFKFTGENLFDNDNGVIYEANYGKLTNNNGKINITNVSIYINVMYPVITLKTPLKPNKDYTIMVKSKKYNYTVWIQNNANDFSKSISSDRLQDGKFRNINSTNEIKRLMFQRGIDPTADNDDEIELTIVEGTKTQYYFEPYRETFYNPTEGFSLNGINEVKDSLNTLSGELIKFLGLIKIKDLSFNMTQSSGRNIFNATLTGAKLSTNDRTPINALTIHYNTVANYKTWVDKDLSYRFGSGNRQISIVDNDFDSVSEFIEARGEDVIVFELENPVTYQKKPKTLPQWVKHCFDSSGRELEATITQ